MTIVRRPCVSYDQRARQGREESATKRAVKLAAEKEAGAAQVPTGSYAERAAQRRAEHLGRKQADKLKAEEKAARTRAELEAVPEHQRRPANTWRAPIAQWESASYRPEITAKLDEYERRAEVEDKRLDLLMEEKAGEHRIATDPRIQDALKHHEAASSFSTPEEAQSWAICKGLILGGAVAEYWSLAAELTKKAEQREAQVTREHLTVQAELKAKFDDAQARQAAALKAAEEAAAAAKKELGDD